MTTLQAVNKHLEKQGIPERLFKGQGYYYFAEGQAHTWYATAIYINTLKFFTLDQVMEEYLSLKTATHIKE